MLTTTPPDESDLKFLSGCGVMGALTRSHHWSATPLGAAKHWPPAQKIAISAVLGSPMLGTVLWGTELRMFYNDAYIPSMGDRHPGALGQPVAAVWGSAWEQVAPDFLRAMDTGVGFMQRRVRLPIVRNGEPVVTWWDFTASAIRDEEGHIVGLLNQGSEITEAVQAEQALLAWNDTLEAQVAERTADRDRMWNTSPDLLLIIDFEGVFRRVNPAWTQTLGYPEAELVGHHVNEFVIADDHRITTQAYETAAAGQQARTENRYRHRDGSTRQISWVAAPAGDVTYATGRDVTAERRRDAELQMAQEQLRHAQKMEAVGQLTGGLAHDFNNLLTGILGNLEMLQRRFSNGRLEDLDRFVISAQRAGKRAASLTQRLLAFARRQTLDPRPTDVNRLIASMEELLRRTVGATTDIEIVGAAGLWPASIDAGQLENAILNLCLNGRDAMPTGGRLTIETANKWIDERTGAERQLKPGQYISVCVSDTGAGMSAETISRAFEPFFTTKPMGEGTGLGLSMVYGFAQQSDGAVRIYSQIGQGTTVCIYLPRHLGNAESEQGEGLESSAAEGRGQTVLVVEDETSIRELLKEVLVEAGYVVRSAADGASALKVFESPAPIDLLVTDVGLPNGMNGRQVADAARVLHPRLQVLFITGFAENAAVGNGHLDAGMELLTKPFTLDALAAKVGEMIKRP